MSENTGYFGEYASEIEDLPTGDGFKDGFYEVRIDDLKDHRNEENDSHGIMVFLECVDQDSDYLGMKHMWWINVPHRHKYDNDQKFRQALGFFKRALDSLGLTTEEQRTFNADTDKSRLIGQYGTAQIKTKGNFTNVYFKIDDDHVDKTADSAASSPADQQSSVSDSATSDNAQGAVDFSKFLNG